MITSGPKKAARDPYTRKYELSTTGNGTGTNRMGTTRQKKDDDR